MICVITLPAERPGAGLIRVHMIEPAADAITVGSWSRPPGANTVEYTLWSRAGQYTDGDEFAAVTGVVADLRSHLEQRVQRDGRWWQ